MISGNKRIVLNFAATYGRSLFALACGLLSGRWTLMALGEVDYGLFGLVGGLTAFVAFINNLMAGAVSRFYAFAVGESQRQDVGEGKYEVCRQWFSIAVAVHSIVPVTLLIVGYPLGLWAVEHFLSIPPEKVAACIWVWRYVCVSCFVGMVSIPYVAMYTAKQEIAELTIYSVVQTAANVVFLYYIVTHAGQWLVVYAGWMCLLSALPQVIISLRAVCVFEECRFKWHYVYDRVKIRELFTFAGFRFFGALCILINTQGLAVLTNKFLGPVRNAAMTVGNSLSSQSETLAGALDTALSPAIANAYGAGQVERMRGLCYKSCKFSALLMLLFALPLSLEVNNVMVLWLKTPPDYSASLCVCLLVCLVLEKITSGHWMAIFAVGKIGGYQMFAGVTGLLALAFAWFFLWRGTDLIGVGYALILSKIAGVGVRLHFGKTVGGLGIGYWMKKIFCPLLMLSLFSLAFGCLIRLTLEPTFGRIVLTTMVLEAVFLPLAWLVVLDGDERSKLRVALQDRLNKVTKRQK